MKNLSLSLSQNDVEKIEKADDFHVSPFPDGKVIYWLYI